MKHIKYFIHDILSLDKIDDKIISEIFVKDGLSYYKLFNQKRLKEIIKINSVYKTIFKKECPVLLIKSINLNEVKDNEAKCLIKYLIEGSLKQYRLAANKEELDNLVKQSEKIVCEINTFEIPRIKMEIIKILEKRHDIKMEIMDDYDINNNKTLFEYYKEGIKIKYDKTIKEYFKSNYLEIAGCFKNSFNDTINIKIDNINVKNLYSTFKDYESYIIHNDRCFQRMLSNNDAIYIDVNTPKHIIHSFLRQCNKNGKTPIVFAKNNFVADSESAKYSYIRYNVKNESYMSMVPADLIQNFINCVNNGNNINVGIPALRNISLIEDTIDFGVVLGKQKSLSLTKIDKKYHPHIIDIIINLFLKQQYAHMNGIYNLIKYVCKYNLLANDDYYSNKINKKCILITDNRANIMNIVNLHITLNNLVSSEWDFVFIGSEKSITFMKEYSIKNLNTTYIHDYRLDKELFNIEVYNEIMKDHDIWFKIGVKYDYCLLIQDDSSLMKKGFENSEFINCDYVGSPWADHDCNKEIVDLCGHLCGNGGFSYRNIETMKKVTSKFGDYKKELFNNNLQYMPEDVYFSRHVPKVGGYIPQDTSSSFGSEQVMSIGSFGFHKLWAYHSIEKVDEFFDYY